MKGDVTMKEGQRHWILKNSRKKLRMFVNLLEIPMITLNFSRLFKKEMSEVLLISSVSPL